MFCLQTVWFLVPGCTPGHLHCWRPLLPAAFLLSLAVVCLHLGQTRVPEATVWHHWCTFCTRIQIHLWYQGPYRVGSLMILWFLTDTSVPFFLSRHQSYLLRTKALCALARGKPISCSCLRESSSTVTSGVSVTAADSGSLMHSAKQTWIQWQCLRPFQILPPHWQQPPGMWALLPSGCNGLKWRSKSIGR